MPGLEDYLTEYDDFDELDYLSKRGGSIDTAMDAFTNTTGAYGGGLGQPDPLTSPDEIQLPTVPALLPTPAGAAPDSTGGYLAGIAQLSKAVQEKRAEATDLGNKRMDPEEVAAAAILSIAPALIGLGIGGKRGLSDGSMIGAKTALGYNEQNRIDKKEQAAQADKQATALEQALGLEIRQGRTDERQKRQFDQQTEIAKEGNATRKELAGQNIEARKEAQTEKDQKKQDSLINTDFIKYGDSDKPVDEKNARKDGEVIAGYVPLLNRVNHLKENWDTEGLATPSEKAKELANLIMLIKAPGVNNGGANFSVMEKVLNSAGLPVQITLNSDKADILKAIQNNMDKFDSKKAFDGLLDVFGNRFNDTLLTQKPDLSGKFSYLTSYIKTPGVNKPGGGLLISDDVMAEQRKKRGL